MGYLFHPLGVEIESDSLFTNPFDYIPDELTLFAVNDLQKYLKSKDDFGLVTARVGKQIGKMFGVLLVQCDDGKVGYLRAFSGKLLDSNHHDSFVPPVYDSLAEDGFLSRGMLHITELSKEIVLANAEQNTVKSLGLKEKRKQLSLSLQARLFDEYIFFNKYKEQKNVRQIFEEFGRFNLPAGAGECALPKLLQYAFQNNLKPLRMAEFWWGKSPKANNRIHGYFYPSCDEKCRPILSYMLKGIEFEKKY